MKGDKSQRGIIIIKNELYIFMGENIKNLEYFKRHENVYYFDRDYSNENRVSLNKSVLSLNTRKILKANDKKINNTKKALNLTFLPYMKEEN